MDERSHGLLLYTQTSPTLRTLNLGVLLLYITLANPGPKMFNKNSTIGLYTYTYINNRWHASKHIETRTASLI